MEGKAWVRVERELELSDYSLSLACNFTKFLKLWVTSNLTYIYKILNIKKIINYTVSVIYKTNFLKLFSLYFDNIYQI
jgi:hypothetical protein